MAGVATFRLGHADFFLAPVGGFLEAEFQVVAKIVAALRLRGVGASAPKEVFKNAAASKDLAKDFKRIMETPASEGAPVEGRVAILIVGGALLRIGKDFVGLAQFFELIFGQFIRVFVRMIFYRQLPVGLFDLFRSGIFFEAEDLVVIALGHGS